MKKTSERRPFFRESRLGENAFFLQCPDSLCAQHHSDFLAFEFEGLFLKVRLEDTVCASQRKANVVAELLSFSSEFTSCCHNRYSFYPFSPQESSCYNGESEY